MDRSTTERRHKHRPTLRPVLGLAAAHCLLLAVSLVTLAPYVWSVLQSFKSSAEAGSPGLLPRTWTLDNYLAVLTFASPDEHFSFIGSYLNSIIVAASVTAAALLSSTLAGFVLAAYRFRGKETLFTLLIATFMVPFSVILVPLYITVSRVGLHDTLSGLIVTGLWSPFGIFLMRQFMEGVPSEILDAGRIDGASEWRIVGQLMIPLSTSALGVLAVYTFMRSWDDFLWPHIVLDSGAKWTLPLLLAGGLGASTPIASAIAILTILPVLVIYGVVAKYFIRSIGVLGLKA